MPRRGHTEEQILRALRQAESGTKISDICREHGSTAISNRLTGGSATSV